MYVVGEASWRAVFSLHQVEQCTTHLSARANFNRPSRITAVTILTNPCYIPRRRSYS